MEDKTNSLEGVVLKDITLVVISPLRGFVQPNGKITLTEKFVDGMKLYRDLWDGPILHLCAPATQPSDNLDNIEVEMKTREFETVCAPMSADFIRATLPKRSIVIVSVGEEFNATSGICRQLGIPCVYVTEYSLKTRHQIVAENQRSVVHGAWQKLRQTQQEIAQRKAISIANAVQCNGLPTFDAYNRINNNAHLFFDNRTDTSMLATDEQVFHRSFENRQGKKLRLAFSGRLNLMKGVDDLLLVAEHLRSSLNERFELSICGDGEYAEQLRSDINKRNLGELVKMRGVLNFKSQLVPFITSEIDIFICCHRQGDPSCTYVETMACGVPIIGYANEAWSKLSAYSNSGWVTPIGDAKSMADRIAALDRAPEIIEGEAGKSLRFAKEHTFEKTFQGRIDHLMGVADEHRYQ